MPHVRVSHIPSAYTLFSTPSFFLFLYRVDSPATGRLVGCFEDEPTKSGQLQRALPNFRSDLRETNSPRTCLNICYQMGFRFAGLQDG